MEEQRLQEWTTVYNDDYFNRQFKNPYRSTVKFCDWLEDLGVLTGKSKDSIMDLCTGKGANIYYMKQRFPDCSFLGQDINDNLVKEGNLFFEREKITDCHLEHGDLYHPDTERLEGKFKGVTMYQTLSWLPEYEEALTSVLKLNPEWIALTSLFYEGLIDSKIEISEFRDSAQLENQRKSFYNIYSLPRIQHFLAQKGYTFFKCMPFEIDIDLPKPVHPQMQTYTEKLSNGKRIQVSGPVLMNWYFIYAARK